VPVIPSRADGEGPHSWSKLTQAANRRDQHHCCAFRESGGACSSLRLGGPSPSERLGM